MDLQQTVNENGLVDGSEVHYLINQALSNKQRKELHVPSRAEVVSSVVAEPHEDIVLTQGYIPKCGRLQGLFWVGCNVSFGSVAMSNSVWQYVLDGSARHSCEPGEYPPQYVWTTLSGKPLGDKI